MERTQLNERIKAHVTDSNGEITPKELFEKLIAEGVLNQETIDNVLIVGPLDEWIDMKIRWAKKSLGNS